MIISGKDISLKIKNQLRLEVEEIKKSYPRLPKLVVILVGDNQASQTYVRNKERGCEYIGIESDLLHHGSSFSEKELLQEIDKLNKDTEVDGIMINLPSNIVGKPVALLCLQKNATVTIAHSKTKNLKEVCKRADVLIAAIGKAKFFNHEYVKDGAIVLDVGINRDENNKLCGDVDFDDVKDVVKAITPVPGGVGPMTITMLMKNTINAFYKRNGG